VRSRKMPETLFCTAPNAARASACAIACAVLHNTARTLSAETLLSRSPSCPCSVSISVAVLLHLLRQSPPSANTTIYSTNATSSGRPAAASSRRAAWVLEKKLCIWTWHSHHAATHKCAMLYGRERAPSHGSRAHTISLQGCILCSTQMLHIHSSDSMQLRCASVGEDVAHVATHVEHRFQDPYASRHAWGTCCNRDMMYGGRIRHGRAGSYQTRVSRAYPRYQHPLDQRAFIHGPSFGAPQRDGCPKRDDLRRWY
jgi:hypothetical protein